MTNIAETLDFEQLLLSEKPEDHIPYGYTVVANKLYRVIEGKDEKKFVCDYVPHIDTIYFNERDNQTFWTILWIEPDGTEQRLKLIPKGTFATASRIVDLYEKGLSVTSDNSAELVRYFQRYESTFKSKIERKLAYDQLGYVQGGFLLPNQFISSDSRQDVVFKADSGNADFVKAFEGKGTLDEWLLHVFEPAKTRKIPLLYTLASIGSPVLNVFNVPTFIAEVSYITSAGKTVTMKIARSVWGSKEVMETWFATFSGIERRTIMLNHLPYIIDDTKNRKLKDEEMATLVYTLASGKEATRSGVKNNHIVRRWNNIIISTGERKITEFSNDGGTAARVLAIHDKPIEYNVELVNHLENAVEEYYGTAGTTFLKWFVEQDERSIQNYKMLLREYELQYANQTKNPIIKRTAKYMAFIRLVADMVQAAFGVEIDSGLLDELWLDIVKDNQHEEADRPLQAFKQAIEFAHRNKLKFYRKKADHEKIDAYGEWLYPYETEGKQYNQNEEKIIYYYPNLLKDLLKSWGHKDSNTILEQWKKRGYIKTNGERKDLNRKSIISGTYQRWTAIDTTHKDLQDEAE